jgi:acetolactate synthase-1/2/3 large subunit
VSAEVAVTQSQAQALVGVLERLGYRTAFGIPGGAIAGIFAALSGRTSLRVVLSQHEGGAAYMAMGQSLATAGRRIGLCFATSGPGITNLITGVAAAFEEQVPMFVLTGNVSTDLIGKGAAQDAFPGGTHAVGMLQSVTARSVTAMTARDIVPLAIELHEEALRSRRPVHLNVPVNLAAAPYGARPAGAEPAVDSLVSPRAAQVCAPSVEDDRALAAAIAALLAAERPLIFVGHGIKASGLGAALAETLAATALPALVTSHGKGVLSEDHPMFMGTFGFAAPPSSTAFLLGYQPDAIAFLGTDLGETSTAGWSPLLARPRVKIHIDRDARAFNKTYAVDMPVRAQIGAFLSRLVDASRSDDVGGVGRRRRMQAVATHCPAAPVTPAFAATGLIHPAAFMTALGGRLPRDAQVFADIGNTMAWAIHHLPIRDRQQFHVPMALGAMGSALCAAIGAKAACPERPVVALVGDCAMMMHGAEMLTALLAQLHVKVFVLNDQGHGMVDHGLALLGTPVSGLRHSRRVDFVAFGRALGVAAFHVGSLRELAQIDWAHHLRAPEPLIVDVAIDPAVVPPILARTRVLGVGHAQQTGGES